MASTRNPRTRKVHPLEYFSTFDYHYARRVVKMSNVSKPTRVELTCVHCNHAWIASVDELRAMQMIVL